MYSTEYYVLQRSWAWLGILLLGSEPWQRGWQNLAYSLTTGDIAFERVMGDPFFKYLDEHPEYGTPFHQWMTISTTMAALAIAEAYDFAPFSEEKLVEVQQVPPSELTDRGWEVYPEGLYRALKMITCSSQIGRFPMG